MLVAANRKFKLGFPLTLAQPAPGKLIVATQQPLRATKKNKLFATQIFPIKFKYLQRAVHTKVLKVIYGSGESIYKVILSSAISRWGHSCWLQRRLQGWVTLLGREQDEKLTSAIASAIECQEPANLSKSTIV